MTDPTELSAIIKELMEAGVITPEEGRQVAEKVFNKELKTLEAAWVKQPIALTLAGIPVQEDGVTSPWVGGESDELVADATSTILTPTAMGNVVTVNEARAAAGLGPKLLPDGSPDPTGDYSVQQYMYAMMGGQMQMPGAPPQMGYAPDPSAIAARHPYAGSLGAVATKSDGAGPNLGGSAADVPDVAGGTLAGADLAQAGGLQPAQGPKPKFRRLAPQVQRMKPLTEAAKALLAVRNALFEGEGDLAKEEFLHSKRASLSPVERARMAKVLVTSPFILALVSDVPPKA